MLPSWLLLSAALLQAPAIPPQATLEKERGDNLVAADQLESALRAYDAAIGLAPTFVEAMNQKGVTLVRLGRMEDAVAAFDKALELAPDYSMAHYNRGFALKKLGRHDEVIRAFEKYIQLMPDDASGYFQLAEGHYVKGNFDEALQNYERFVSMEKDPSQSKKIDHSNKRIAELKEKKNAAAAASAAPAAEAQAPSKGRVSGPKPTPDASGINAGVPPNSVLYITPERESLCNAKMAEGVSLRADGKGRDAVFALQEAVQANPKNMRALYELAEAYASLDYFAQAAERWERVLEADIPQALRSQTKDKLANAYRQMDARGIPHKGSENSTKVIPLQKKADALPTTKPMDPKAQEAFLKGTVLFNDRDYEGAIHQYDIAIVIHPDISELYSARGSAWLASNDPTRALADFTQARHHGPALALPIYGMAEANYALERFSDALENYELFMKSTAADAKDEMRTKAKARIDQLKQRQTQGPQLQFNR